MTDPTPPSPQPWEPTPEQLQAAWSALDDGHGNLEMRAALVAGAGPEVERTRKYEREALRELGIMTGRLGAANTRADKCENERDAARAERDRALAEVERMQGTIDSLRAELAALRATVDEARLGRGPT